MTFPRVDPAGEGGYYVRLGEGLDPALADRVMGLCGALDQRRPAAVLDVVPGIGCVLVLVRPEADPAPVRAFIDAALAAAPARPPRRPREVEIPVAYDPTVAPDLAPLAAEKGISVDELIALHTAPAYRCLCLGFRPGFPFLGGLDERLSAARLPTPRVRVPAGSVGIGGRQTGVYPVDSPGGWRIIGRTPAVLFDPARADPFLVHPGDTVRFVRLDAPGRV